MLEELYQETKERLREQYRGVFPPKHLEIHFENYVLPEFSERQFQDIQKTIPMAPGCKLLDLGCGFGSFVRACRLADVEAVGVDICEEDLDFARKRHALEQPDSQPQQIYLQGDAQATELPSDEYDFVTAWNLLEHVPSYRRVISEAYRVLRPGGVFMGIAPNYFTFRREAHYQVPWAPLFPRWLAAPYLRLCGRRPDFFLNDIYYITNWGALRHLKKCGFQSIHPQLASLENPDDIVSSRKRKIVQAVRRLKLTPLLKLAIIAGHWNPFRRAICFWVSKPA